MYVIGDVHGKVNEYFQIVENKKNTVQVGDFGFASAWNKLEYSGLGKGEHWVIPGNHDDYDICLDSSYCLGDYGTFTLDKEFFFVRGGLSIDRVYREAQRIQTHIRTWWPEEELTYGEMKDCEDRWTWSSAEILIAHCPPRSVIPRLHKDQKILESFGFSALFCDNTSILLEEMVRKRKPKICVFGHHHKSFDQVVHGVRYIGLSELECREI